MSSVMSILSSCALGGSKQHGVHRRPSWWQRRSKDAEVGPLLWGSTVFGDNVEDEWFIVALLMHLTHLLPGTTAR